MLSVNKTRLFLDNIALICGYRSIKWNNSFPVWES